MDAIAAMLNIFIDPKASVDRFAGKKWAWLWPVVVMGILSAAIGLVTTPIAMRVMQMNPPGEMTAEQFRQSAPMMEMLYKIGSLFSPILIAAMLAVSAGIIAGMSAVMDIKVPFRDLYNLVAHCGLVGMVQHVAGAVVIYLRRDDMQSILEMQPAFGLNIFLSEGSSRLLYGFLGYFSIFTIWYIVILAAAFAHLAKVPTGRAFTATMPVWLLGLLFALAGAVFQQA